MTKPDQLPSKQLVASSSLVPRFVHPPACPGQPGDPSPASGRGGRSAHILAAVHCGDRRQSVTSKRLLDIHPSEKRVVTCGSPRDLSRNEATFGLQRCAGSTASSSDRLRPPRVAAASHSSPSASRPAPCRRLSTTFSHGPGSKADASRCASIAAGCRAAPTGDFDFAVVLPQAGVAPLR